jgi:hypothetical protein
VQIHLAEGVLSPKHASIGGTFWPSDIYAAAGEIEGVVAVNGLNFSSSVAIDDAGPTCIETGKYLDFRVSVTAVHATGFPV